MSARPGFERHGRDGWTMDGCPPLTAAMLDRCCINVFGLAEVTVTQIRLGEPRSIARSLADTGRDRPAMVPVPALMTASRDAHNRQLSKMNHF